MPTDPRRDSEGEEGNLNYDNSRENVSRSCTSVAAFETVHIDKVVDGIIDLSDRFEWLPSHRRTTVPLGSGLGTTYARRLTGYPTLHIVPEATVNRNTTSHYDPCLVPRPLVRNIANGRFLGVVRCWAIYT